ncbi:MAG: DUF2577 domain-containing protein [Eubacterium sp.]|jgi:hypothetical protein|nr:DUF2577 domain-containing protein [Eubacterium sp.]
MADWSTLIGTIKKASVEAVDAKRPTDVVFGTVKSVSPLEIDIEQKETLRAPQLVLTRNVTDYTVEMTVEHKTEDETQHKHKIIDTYTFSGESLPTNHSHEYKGKKEFTIHNALVEGDKVVLIGLPGGQRYVIVDRLG